MANGDFFDAFLRNASNYNGGEPEYYEDTHDANGNYTGSAPLFGMPQQPPQYSQQPPQQPSAYGQQPPLFAQQQQPQYPPQMQQQPPAYALQQSVIAAQQRNETKQQGVSGPQSIPLPTLDQYVSPQLNQNFVIYRPRTTKDVEQLIAYLRRREPALVDLDPISDSPDAQRLMDFTSGAAYALGDRVMAIRRNLFLITPDSIDVLKPDGES